MTAAARAAATRLAGAAVVVVLVTALTWLMLHVLRPQAFPPSDRPLHTGLADFLERAFLHWDLGRSNFDGRPVGDLILAGLPADLALLAGGLVFGLVTGVGIGVLSAAAPRGPLSRLADGLAAVAMSAPVYVVGMVLLYLLGDGIAQLHVGFEIPTEYTPLRDDPARWLVSMIAPWLVVGLPLAGLVLRVTRSAAAEVTGEQFIQTAHGKGVSPRRVLLRHAGPPAMTPALTAAGASANIMLANLVLVEQVFTVPGIFRELTRGIARGDFQLIYGLTLVGAAYIALMTIVVDATVRALDPRLRT